VDCSVFYNFSFSCRGGLNCLTFGLNQSKTLLNTIPYLIGKIDDVQAGFSSDDSGVTRTRNNDDQHQLGWISHVSGDPRIY
jgi:hypothetical protein